MATPIILSTGSVSGAGTPGEGRNDLVISETVFLSDTEPLNTGASYLWTFEDIPIGSSASMNNSTSAIANFSPDITGSYRIRCLVNGVDFSVVVIAVPLPNSTGRIPSFGEELQYNAAGNTKGWHEAQTVFMRAVDTLVVTGSTLDSAYDGGGSGAGRSITADAGAVTITNNTADTNSVLEISKIPSSSASGNALSLTTGANATGNAINISHSGSGAAIVWDAGQALIPDGALSTPAIAFNNSTNTGFYFATTRLRIASDGTEVLNFTSGATSSLVVLRNIDGTVSLPSYSFTSSPQTGLFSSSGSLESAVNGVLRLQLATITTSVISNTTTETNPSLVLSNVGSFSASSGTQTHAQVVTNVNQSATAAYNAFEVDVTETATGSGDRNVIRTVVGGSTVFRVNSVGAVIASTGSAALPTHTFESDLTTGIYYGGSNDLGLSAGATLVALANSTPQLVLSASGTDATPELSFASSTSSGLRYGTDDLRAIVGGTLRLQLQTNTTDIRSNVTTTTGTAFSLSNTSSFSAAAGTQTHVQVATTINQSATAAYNAFEVSVTETAVGSGDRNVLRASVGGSTVFRVNSDGQTILPLGSAATPSLVFEAHTNDGIYSDGTTVFFSTAGVSRLGVNSLGIDIAAVGSEANPSITFGGGTSGLFQSTNDIAVSVATTEVARWSSTAYTLQNLISRITAASHDYDRIVGTFDPSVAGQVADIGSIFQRNTGQLWIKTGGTNTDWTRITTTADSVSVTLQDAYDGGNAITIAASTPVTLNYNALAETTSDATRALHLNNSTAATTGWNHQWSPTIDLSGTYWIDTPGESRTLQGGLQTKTEGTSDETLDFRLSFYTNVNAAGWVEKAFIDSNANFCPAADRTGNIGRTSGGLGARRWNAINAGRLALLSDSTTGGVAETIDATGGNATSVLNTSDGSFINFIPGLIEYDGAGTINTYTGTRFINTIISGEAATATVTDAATVYIAAAPSAGSLAAITNPYALWVDDGACRFDGPLVAPLGSASAPSFTFLGHTNDGMFSNGANVSFAVGGILKVNIASSQLNINISGSEATPSLTWVGDDIGFFRAAADTLAGSTGGTECIRWNSSQQTLVPDGVDATPSYSFATEESLGFYKSATNTIRCTGIARFDAAIQGTTSALVDAATIATDASLANTFTVTLGGNRTLGLPTNLVAGTQYTWIVTQDGTGNRTLAYNSVFDFPGGTAPTLSTGANDVDLLQGVYDGTSLLMHTFAANFS